MGTVNIKQRLLTKAAAVGMPLSGTFELTPRCNFSCKMCYIRMTPEEMKPLGRERTATEWLAMGKEAKEAGMTFLLLTGGEPFLRPDFPEIYRGLAEMGFSISINSNGSLLNDELKALFTELPPAAINVTLYGSSPETYKTLCGNADGYERTLNALRWFRDRGILVNLNATLTPLNKGQMEHFQAFAEREGLNLRVNSYNFPPVRRAEGGEITRLEPEEAGVLRAKDFCAPLSSAKIKKIAAQLSQGIEPVDACLPDCGDPMRCHAARSIFWISWNGKMTACGMLNEPYSDPFAEGFANAWNHLREQVAQIRLCPDCINCPERSTCLSCAAITSAETGRFDGKPEYLCRMNHAYREEIRAMAEEKPKQ